MFLTQAKQATKVTKTTKAKKRQQWQGNKTPSGDRMEEKKKKPWGKQTQSPFSPGKQTNERTVYDYVSGSITGQKSDRIVLFEINLVGLSCSHKTQNMFA